MSPAMNEHPRISERLVSIAPYIGLLGTVSGILFSFACIDRAGPRGLSITDACFLKGIGVTAVGSLLAALAAISYSIFISNGGGKS